jgi:hypothetical protein
VLAFAFAIVLLLRLLLIGMLVIAPGGRGV